MRALRWLLRVAGLLLALAYLGFAIGAPWRDAYRASAPAVVGTSPPTAAPTPAVTPSAADSAAPVQGGRAAQASPLVIVIATAAPAPAPAAPTATAVIPWAKAVWADAVGRGLAGRAVEPSATAVGIIRHSAVPFR